MAGSSDFHFPISIVLAFTAGILWGAYRREGHPFLAAAAGFLAALGAGIAKEIGDLLVNPWHMTGAALRSDSARDMLWNLAGALVGAAGLALVVATGRQLFGDPARPAAIPAGPLPGDAPSTPGLPDGGPPA